MTPPAPSATPTTNCPICNSPDYRIFFKANGIPVEEGRLCTTRHEALSIARGDVHLAYCGICGYIGNTRFDPGPFRFDESYNFSLHASPTYQSFIQEVATGLIDRYNLRRKTILEIACGQGEFLALLCGLGENFGIGIDPSLKNETRQCDHSGRIRWIADYYSEKYADLDVDCVCCRHLLQVLPRPKDFVEMVRRAIGARHRTTVYSEVPNGMYVLDQGLIWNIVYERCSWFTPYSIARLFEMCGFEVLSSAPCYHNGQYLKIEAQPAGLTTGPSRTDSETLTRQTLAVERFGSLGRTVMDAWKDGMQSLTTKGLRVAVWGAGAAAVTFFNTFHLTGQIGCVVDINPRLHGHFIPGTDQQVKHPNSLKGYNPDIVLLTNATYENEIRRNLCEFGLTSRVYSLANPAAAHELQAAPAKNR